MFRLRPFTAVNLAAHQDRCAMRLTPPGALRRFPAMPMTTAGAVEALPAPPAFTQTSALPDAQCYHCGLPNPPGHRWHGVFKGAPRTFCCAGCLGIAQTIHAAGLDAFYAQRTASGARPDAADVHGDEWSAWDDAATQDRFVRPAGKMLEVSLLLDGVHCSACTWLIEHWLLREAGVAEVSVNYATRRARVVWDPAQRRLSELLRAILRIGYRAFPYDPARREALARQEARSLLLRMAVALLAMMQVMMFAVPAYLSSDGVEPQHRQLLDWASLTLTVPALVYCAWPFFRGAWRDVRVRRLGMDVPIALGLVAAFAASVVATLTGTGTTYYDSVTMFIALLLVARYVEFQVRRRAGEAIEGVARVRPVVADRLERWPDSDVATRVTAATLRADDVLLVRAGAVVPADGVVLEGQCHVEEAILTGEARACAKEPGSRVLAGSMARDGTLVVRVTAVGEATRLAAVERLVQRAASERPRAARLADVVASRFVTALLAVAAVTGIAWWFIAPEQTLTVVFAVLAVSCPCALSLATPAALSAAAGALTRQGVVITRPDALETLARVTHVVFDKTGTLTCGRIALLGTWPAAGHDALDVLAIAAALERQSEHPLATTLVRAAAGLPAPIVRTPRVVPGEGVEGTIDGRRMRIGRFSFVADLAGAEPPVPAGVDATATLVALGDASGVVAVFTFGDQLRPGARALIERLHALGLSTMLLSGDRARAVEAVRVNLGIQAAEGDALPERKRAVIASLQDRGAVVAMVGDGVNDAPSLAQAQVSMSLGSATPLAQWTADVVILADDVEHIGATLLQGRRALRIVRQNLAWAFAYNVLAIPAAAFGYVTPLVAAAGMSLSSLFVILNALRAARRTTKDATAVGVPASAAA